MAEIEIYRDDLIDDNILNLLSAHRLEMLKHSPPESVHALKANDLIACEG